MDTKKIVEFAHDFNEFMVRIREYEPIAIISHDNTDLDGAAAALGIYLILNYYSHHSSQIDLILSHTNQFVTKTLQNVQLEEDIIENDAYVRGEYNTIIIVDTPYLPPYFQKEFKKVILVDHHLEAENNRENPSDLSGAIPTEKFLFKVIDPTASSCSEMIGQLWKFLDEKITKSPLNKTSRESVISQLLLMGLLMDSSGLRYSENSVIPILDFFVNKGADLPTARKMSIREYPSDVKLARIKGAIRCEEPILIEKWIVLITHVNSHESAVCTALLGLGADLAFCISKRKKKTFRLIARASEGFQHANDFHLGKFMEKMALEFHGNSGGHKGAAGMNGQNYPQDLKKQIISELKKELNNSVL
ncbi:MAG: DHH family phosphoesterase [Promethearchaeota archaeon]